MRKHEATWKPGGKAHCRARISAESSGEGGTQHSQGKHSKEEGERGRKGDQEAEPHELQESRAGEMKGTCKDGGAGGSKNTPPKCTPE